jgi:hypothetical protein
VHEEIARFIQLSDVISLHASTQLLGLVDGLRYWIRGYMDWVAQDTMRYAAAFAANDADDRGML